MLKALARPLELLFVTLVFLSSLVMGCVYSVYNTDFHHWGFIAGTALDWIAGKHSFTQNYIQYGEGEPLFFAILSHLFPVNITSIGFVISLAYGALLLCIYAGVRRVSDARIAVFACGVAFLAHSYAIYPWPDYFAGLCLALSCLTLMRTNATSKFRDGLIAGALLFAAFLFRNTYILSIALASLSYITATLVSRALRERGALLAICTFTVLSCAYLASLFLHGTLGDWFSQTIGSASTTWHVGADSLILLLQKAFFVLNFGLEPKEVATDTFFCVLNYAALFVCCRLIFGKTQPYGAGNRGLFVFFSLLGLAGILQCSHSYETFRLQNSCVSLYFVFGMFLKENLPDPRQNLDSKNFSQLFPSLLVAVAVICPLFMLFRFPYASAYLPILDAAPGAYSASEVPILRWHRLQPDEKHYFDSLSKLLCDGKKRIVNLTHNSVIPYICPQQPNALMVPFFEPEIMWRVDRPKFAKIAAGKFDADEIVVDLTQAAIGHPGLKVRELAELKVPQSHNYTGRPTVFIYTAFP